MDKTHVNEKIDQSVTDPLDRLLQEKRPASAAKGLAILALFVALAAGAASGWQWWQAYAAGQTSGALQGAVNKLQTGQQHLTQALGALQQGLQARPAAVGADEFSQLQNRYNALAGQLEALQGQAAEYQASQAALQGGLRSLQQRQSTTESGLASVAANSKNTGAELEIAEIDYLLRVGSERLGLFSDPQAADLALRAADVQIEALNDPLFLSVRERIADARRSLAGVPVVDRLKLSSRLAGLQTKIQGLAFPGEVRQHARTELKADAGWWQNFKHTLASLVTVKRRVPEERALLSIADQDYLRQGLWLQLETARLAVMRHDAAAYQSALNRASDTIGRYFQHASAPVGAAQSELKALAGVNIAPKMPDISAPWLQLRQLRDSRRLLQSATPPVSERVTGDSDQ